jgi:hypothetical protein
VGQAHSIIPTAHVSGRPATNSGHTAFKASHLLTFPVDPEAGMSRIDPVASIAKKSTCGLALAAFDFVTHAAPAVPAVPPSPVDPPPLAPVPVPEALPVPEPPAPGAPPVAMPHGFQTPLLHLHSMLPFTQVEPGVEQPLPSAQAEPFAPPLLLAVFPVAPLLLAPFALAPFALAPFALAPFALAPFALLPKAALPPSAESFVLLEQLAKMRRDPATKTVSAVLMPSILG